MKDGIQKIKNEKSVESPNELGLQFVIENGQHEVKQHYWIYDGNRYINGIIRHQLIYNFQ